HFEQPFVFRGVLELLERIAQVGAMDFGAPLEDAALERLIREAVGANVWRGDRVSQRRDSAQPLELAPKFDRAAVGVGSGIANGESIAVAAARFAKEPSAGDGVIRGISGERRSADGER